MSAIDATIFFEGAMRYQLEELEFEMIYEMKNHEIQMREEKIKNLKNKRIVEQLRPLCGEIPQDALDPVTLEPLDKAMVLACSHSFNWETINNLASLAGGLEGMRRKGGIVCPTCRYKFSPYNQMFATASVRSLTKVFKDISEVFNDADTA